MTRPEDPIQIVRGACGHDCPDTCSWVVEVRDGRAERLSGDPAHPFTRGTLCAKVNHYLERVYHPDRVLHPLKRAGRKGEGQFVRVSWDEALTEIASRWTAIAAESGAEAILPYSSAGVQGLIQMASLDRRLFGSMGCSGLDRKICGAVAAAGLSATLGCGTGIDPEEIVHSRFIVLWGTNTIVTNLHFWPVVREAQRRGAKIVVVDPIRTRTAEAADWHVQIKPASDAALALAMMHVMIRDGLVDLEYVSQHALGYDALADRAREYSPNAVADTVGVPAEEIERFAREYATTQPSLLRPLIGMEHHRNGAMQLRTLACLAVLSGSWRHRGGGLARSTHALQFATLDMDRVLMPEVYTPGVRVLNMRDLGDDLCNRELQPPIRSLMVYGANPMVSMPNGSRIREGLLREDLFTVVHELFVTDTALYADYVLPATSQIEHLDLSPAWGHLYLALNRPAIAPRGESVSNTELFRRLAHALGRTEPWLFEDDESMLRGALASGHPWLEGITFEQLWQEGYARLRCPDDWRPFANGGFATRSGKAELYSEPLREQGHDPLPWAGEIRAGDGLQLITGKSLHFLNSGYSNMDRHRRRAGELLIEIHPDDARPRRVAAGDPVRVWNGGGEVRAVCSVSDRVRPGVAWMPFGGLLDASGARRSVNALTPVEPTDWGGGSGLYDAFVEVAPAAADDTETLPARMKHLATLLIVALLTSIACGSTSTSTNVAPSPVRCEAAATPNPSAFPASGGSGNLVVSSARECSWSASSQAAWISLGPPTNGQGDGSIRYTVAPNPAASARRGTVLLGSKSVEITQEPATCRFELDRRSFELAASEGTATVNVDVATGCAWTAKAGTSWITIVEGSQGSGAGRVRFRVSANPATGSRSGSLEVVGLRVDVRQAGTQPGGGPGPVPGPVPSCTYTVAPASADGGPGQTDGSVSVQTDAGCPWTAVSDAPWLTVPAGTTSSGPGSVQYQAAANAGSSSRTGHITVAGAVFTLRQAACSYAIDPTSASYLARGGSSGIDVQTQAPCAWSAHTSESWIALTSGGGTPGAGRLGYEVRPNSNIAARSGTITVGGRNFTVAQEGATSISGRVRSLDGSCPTRRFTVNGQRIRTTSSTDYEEGRCGDLTDGVAVRVKGIIGSDGVLAAFEVDF